MKIFALCVCSGAFVSECLLLSSSGNLEEWPCNLSPFPYSVEGGGKRETMAVFLEADGRRRGVSSKLRKGSVLAARRQAAGHQILLELLQGRPKCALLHAMRCYRFRWGQQGQSRLTAKICLGGGVRTHWYGPKKQRNWGNRPHP